MTLAVLPAMARVVAAMNSAASTTAKISRVMKQAENNAAAVLKDRGNGSNGNAGFVGVIGTASGAAIGWQSANVGTRGGILNTIGSAASHAGDFVVGAGSELFDIGKGIATTVISPAYASYQAGKGLWHIVNNSGAAWDAFKKPYVEAWESG